MPKLKEKPKIYALIFSNCELNWDENLIQSRYVSLSIVKYSKIYRSMLRLTIVYIGST